MFIDWKANKGNMKGRLIMCLFRIANKASINKFYFFLLLPYLVLYRILVEWVLGVEIPYKTKIGKNLVLYHGHSLVINDRTIIGNNCTLRQSTTIGNKKLSDSVYSDCPVIGNFVDIGANVCIIGPVKIGDYVVIGAGSVVIRDIPSNCVAVGNPARVIKVVA